MDDLLHFAINVFREEQQEVAKEYAEQQKRETLKNIHDLERKTREMHAEVQRRYDQWLSDSEQRMKGAVSLLHQLRQYAIGKVEREAEQEASRELEAYRRKRELLMDPLTKMKEGKIPHLEAYKKILEKSVEEIDQQTKEPMKAITERKERTIAHLQQEFVYAEELLSYLQYESTTTQLDEIIQRVKSIVCSEGMAHTKMQQHITVEALDHTMVQLTHSIAQLSAKSEFEPTERQRLAVTLDRLSKERASYLVGFVKAEGPVKASIVLDRDFDTFEIGVFLEELCGATGVDTDQVRLKKVERGSVKLQYEIDQNAAKKLLKCLEDPIHLINTKLRIKTVILGEVDLDVGPAVMDPKWNRTYGRNGDTYWAGAAKDRYDRGNKPYFCPSGWKRYSIGQQSDFDQIYAGWHVAYHGSAGINASSILATGLRTSSQCYAEGRQVVYLSPSIEYSAHPRYAKPWRNKETKKWVQMVFQCRVNPTAILDGPKPETLLQPGFLGYKPVIDPNFKNSELEWLVEGDRDHILVSNLATKVVCYGIMLRESENPCLLPSSKWWSSTNNVQSYFANSQTVI